MQYFATLGYCIFDDRTIHDVRCRTFLTDILGAGAWHTNILSNGLSFDWIAGPPTRYCEQNNKSALSHLPQLQQTVSDWETGGYIERLSGPAFCCNPMTVAVQHNLITNVTKYRPCIDLSRHVNKFIKDFPVKLDDLTVVEELVSPGDFMTALDLENQFFQVRLHPSMRDFLGFMVPDINGIPVYYRFVVMPYGCKPAVSIVTRLLKPLKSYFHRLGIRFSVYVDDGRICASSAVQCRLHMDFVLDILQRVGWRIQWKKTELVPTTRLLHLGFVVDSVLMQYSLLPAKWTVIHTAVADLLNLAIAGRSVPVRQVAAVLGRLVAIRRSHGFLVSILSRSLQHQLGVHVFHHGWVGFICVSHSSLRELTLLLVHAPSFNGRPIPTAAAASHLYDFSLLRGLPAAALPPPEPSFALLADGSWSVLSVPENCSVELNLIITVLTRDRSRLTAAAIRVVYWTTASWSLLQLLRRGASSPLIQDLLFTIRRLERDLILHFVPVWVPSRPPPSLLLSVFQYR